MYDIQVRDYGYEVTCTGEFHILDLANLYNELQNSGIKDQGILLNLGKLDGVCECVQTGLVIFEDNVFEDNASKLAVVIESKDLVTVTNFAIRASDLKDRLRFIHKDENVEVICKNWLLPQKV
jgi:hypothetical protein